MTQRNYPMRIIILKCNSLLIYLLPALLLFHHTYFNLLYYDVYSDVKPHSTTHCIKTIKSFLIFLLERTFLAYSFLIYRCVSFYNESLNRLFVETKSSRKMSISRKYQCCVIFHKKCGWLVF